MANLRGKLAAASQEPSPIRTEQGIGYRFLA
jgi:DNA-binding response OmpR family regulator